MIQHGRAPFLECSSRGERRLSAFNARIRSRSNTSIEAIYQASKVFADGSTGLGWRAAKGRRAVNVEECANLYARLWDEYMAENPDLLDVVLAASGLQDTFGQTGHCCQATELWRIRMSAMAERRTDVASPAAQAATLPRILNKHTHRVPAGAVYIGRGSPWGNPFVIGPDGTRSEVIAKHAAWIDTQPQLLARLPELRGRDLVCFCFPRSCHGETLRRLAHAPACEPV